MATHAVYATGYGRFLALEDVWANAFNQDLMRVVHEQLHGQRGNKGTLDGTVLSPTLLAYVKDSIAIFMVQSRRSGHQQQCINARADVECVLLQSVARRGAVMQQLIVCGHLGLGTAMHAPSRLIHMTSVQRINADQCNADYDHEGRSSVAFTSRTCYSQQSPPGRQNGNNFHLAGSG
jgi:hypothetical protein